jgi:hypothetical protein
MPIEAIPGAAGRSLLYDGLAQTDLDMNNHKLLNLDDSNLDFGASPPTVGPLAHKWLNSWNSTTRVWGITQPNFSDISGILTTGLGGQQQSITQLGTITVGRWHTPIEALYVPVLNQIRPPLGDLTMDSRKIINLADPVLPGDAVNKRFMDFLLQGLNVHEAVRLATTFPIPRANGQFYVDGVLVQEGDRVLVKDYSAGQDPAFLGIFKVHTHGDWEYVADWQTIADKTRAYCTVREGDVNASTGWVQVNPITILFSPEKWVYFSQAGGEPGPPGEDGLGVPPGGAYHQVLRKYDAGDNHTEWADPEGGSGPPPPYAATYIPASDPAGNSDTVFGRMVGLEGYITPLTSGKCVIIVAGSVTNTSGAGFSLVQIIGGSGTAPVNGVRRPASGTIAFGPIIRADQSAASRYAPFSAMAITVGMTIGTRVWFDLILEPQPVGNGSTSTIRGVSLIAYEIP